MSSRAGIYYWKCDRPSAFHGTTDRRDPATLSAALHRDLSAHFPGSITIRPGGGQGNHLTYLVTLPDGSEAFARVEDGPEGDGHLAVESQVMQTVAGLGVPVPRVLAVDASRQRVPFAWQLLEYIAHPDLNHWLKRGELDLVAIAPAIGEAIARWQTFRPAGFGPFDSTLRGYHSTYRDYFHLQLERHLAFLVQRSFLTTDEAADFRRAIAEHDSLLDLPQACLVHKDLALWNILGPATAPAVFIDWDDAIAGHPMDDFSLLGCFHDGHVVTAALIGYQQHHPLPADHRRAFWLHLLRNMIVKSVIRVGAGYFDRTDSFYLIGAGGTGTDLRTFTRSRLQAALSGLREDLPIECL